MRLLLALSFCLGATLVMSKNAQENELDWEEFERENKDIEKKTWRLMIGNVCEYNSETFPLAAGFDGDEFIECIQPSRNETVWPWSDKGEWTQRKCYPGMKFVPALKKCASQRFIRRTEANCANGRGGSLCGSRLRVRYVIRRQQANNCGCQNPAQGSTCPCQQVVQPIAQPSYPQPQPSYPQPQPSYPVQPVRPVVQQPYYPSQPAQPSYPAQPQQSGCGCNIPQGQPCPSSCNLPRPQPQPRPQPVVIRPQPLPQPSCNCQAPTPQPQQCGCGQVQPRPQPMPMPMPRPMPQPSCNCQAPQPQPQQCGCQPQPQPQPMPQPMPQPSCNCQQPQPQPSSCGCPQPQPIVQPQPCPNAPNQGYQGAQPGGVCSWMLAPLAPAQEPASYLQCQPAAAPASPYCGTWCTRPCAPGTIFDVQVQVCVHDPNAVPAPGQQQSCGCQGGGVNLGSCNSMGGCPGQNTVCQTSAPPPAPVFPQPVQQPVQQQSCNTCCMGGNQFGKK